MWKFKRITAHKRPLRQDLPNYNVSLCNVVIEWENGEITSEPLSVIAADDPVTCALHGDENNLLDQPGWKRFKQLAIRNNKMLRMLNQDKLGSYRMSPGHAFGHELTRDNDYEHVVKLDERNGNRWWQEATKLDMD